MWTCTFTKSKLAISDNLRKIHSEMYELADMVLVLGESETNQLYLKIM